MAFDYPSSPVLNQVYTAPTGQGYVWSGTAWNLAQTSPQAPVASDNPPANPYAGQLWLRSTTGALYCWYADPNSSQWIQIPGIAPIADPYPFVTANMQLLSMGAGIVGLNTQKDGSGTSGALWSGLNEAHSFANPGYQKFPSGLIVQFGQSVSANADYTLTFPTAFPSQCIGVAQLASVAGIGATTFYVAQTSNVSRTTMDIRTRSQVNGATAAATNCPVMWIAVGF